MGQRHRYWIKDRVVFVVVWSVFHVMRLLPVVWASAIGGCIGRRLGACLPRLANRARRNLQIAFPEKTDQEHTLILQGMWDNLGRFAGEFTGLDRIQVQSGPERVIIDGQDHLIKALETGGFLFTAHLANWEVAIRVISCALDIPLVCVYRAANNPLIDSLIQTHRHRYAGCTFIPKGPDGSRRLLRAVGAGDVIGIMVDQKMNDGISVPFFGYPAMTAPAIARLAIHSGQPVYGVRIIRLGGMRFKLVCAPPFFLESTGDTTKDVYAGMTRIHGVLETWIRDHPEQWFWVHNRWPSETGPPCVKD